MLPELPINLRELYISNNKVKILPQLPDTIEELNISNNRGMLKVTKTPKYYCSQTA